MSVCLVLYLIGFIGLGQALGPGSWFFGRLVAKERTMVKETIINGQVFLEQTTYYCYRQGDTRETGIPYLTTSSREVFNQNKRHARKMEKRTKAKKS